MSMRAQTSSKQPTAMPPSFISRQSGLLQRKCACGGSSGLAGECKECKQEMLQRKTANNQEEASAAPPVVNEAISSAGQPLDDGTRLFMQSHLAHDFSRVRVYAAPHGQSGLAIGQPHDHYEREADRVAEQALSAPPEHASRSAPDSSMTKDFSDVRVHTDARAAESAKAVNALAYTVGRDVVFAEGQYAPETKEGRRLIAHELVHVFQQGHSTSAAVQRTPPPTDMDKSQREFVNGAIEKIRTMGQIARTDLATKKAKINEDEIKRRLTATKETQAQALETIHKGLSDDAALTKDLRTAYVDTVQAIITLAKSSLQKTSHELYEQYGGQIHEWAWPQAQADPTANELSATLRPEEQQRITVITAQTNIPDLNDLFSTTGAKITIPLPQGVNAHFSTGIAAPLQRGLQNVAGKLIPNPLVLNSTITLTLDLEAYGGDFAAFRFTYLEHIPANKKDPITQEVLIERLGSIGKEKMPPSAQEANEKKFKAHNFTRGSGWSDEQYQQLLAAISQVPDSLLSPVDKLDFRRQSVNATDPKVGGHYDPDAHAVTMFDVAFDASMMRVGAPGAGLATDAVHSIMHEIGHAIDLLPLRKAWKDLEQAHDVRKTAFSQFEDPPGSENYKFPNSEKGHWKELSDKVKAAEDAKNKTRSASGYRWKAGAGNMDDMVEFEEKKRGKLPPESNEFRLAAGKDGNVRITEYSNKEWQEYFAESFSLYIADPDTLQRLRPNVYAYFIKNHPK